MNPRIYSFVLLVVAVLASCHTTNTSGGAGTDASADDSGIVRDDASLAPGNASNVNAPDARDAATPVADAATDAEAGALDAGDAAVVYAAVPEDSLWAEAASIDALVKSCAWKPDEGQDFEHAVYALCDSRLYDQSCMPDPCRPAHDSCAPACGGNCNSCTSECVSTCSSCKQTCTTAACKHACAETTAACENSCIAKRDQCKKDKCEPAYAACQNKLAARWKKFGCAKDCARLAKCLTDCSAGTSPTDEENCRAGCTKSASATCPGDLAAVCENDGPNAFAPPP